MYSPSKVKIEGLKQFVDDVNYFIRTLAFTNLRILYKKSSFYVISSGYQVDVGLGIEEL
jgi:hypothetical protein